MAIQRVLVDIDGLFYCRLPKGHKHNNKLIHNYFIIFLMFLLKDRLRQAISKKHLAKNMIGVIAINTIRHYF